MNCLNWQTQIFKIHHGDFKTFAQICSRKKNKPSKPRQSKPEDGNLVVSVGGDLHRSKRAPWQTYYSVSRGSQIEPGTRFHSKSPSRQYLSPRAPVVGCYLATKSRQLSEALRKRWRMWMSLLQAGFLQRTTGRRGKFIWIWWNSHGTHHHQVLIIAFSRQFAYEIATRAKNQSHT